MLPVRPPAAAVQRGSSSPELTPMSKPSFAARTFVGWFGRLNDRRPWHRLPLPVALLNLIALRVQLRENNLTDTRTPDPSGRRPGVTLADCPHQAARFRTPDGSYNALDDPDMGMAGTRFARNVALDKAFPESMPGLMEPNPHTISRTLMRRQEFTPATSINLLAASWIQFQTHDWFAHGRETDEHLELDLPEDHQWHENPMRVPRTLHDHTRSDQDAHLPPTYINRLTHWWDSSSIYGSSEERPQAGAHLRRRQAGRQGRPAAARHPDRHRRSPGSAKTGGSASGCCTRCSLWSTTRSATRSSRSTPS